MSRMRVLVVDDSAYNRRTISEMLSTIPDVEVVGKATDGDEALRMVDEITPDLITLDLEMPRMDGFKFLRLLMARRPTPVIVVSGYSNKENVFRALELGALDFVAKPSRAVTSELREISEELSNKVALVRHLSPASVDPRRRGSLGGGRTATGAFATVTPTPEEQPAPTPSLPRSLIVVGASTGGPTALVELFARLPSTSAVVVAQHMPGRFTSTFAQRLDRVSSLTVREASGTTKLVPGVGLICPGGRCIDIEGNDENLRARVVDASSQDAYVPSIDRLFRTAARAMGDRVVAVVLTGMGDDGAEGIGAVKRESGYVLAEAPETAVIYGMPGAAMRTGRVDDSLPLSELTVRVAALAR